LYGDFYDWFLRSLPSPWSC